MCWLELRALPVYSPPQDKQVPLHDQERKTSRQSRTSITQVHRHRLRCLAPHSTRRRSSACVRRDCSPCRVLREGGGHLGDRSATRLHGKLEVYSASLAEGGVTGSKRGKCSTHASASPRHRVAGEKCGNLPGSGCLARDKSTSDSGCYCHRYPGMFPEKTSFRHLSGNPPCFHRTTEVQMKHLTSLLSVLKAPGV